MLTSTEYSNCGSRSYAKRCVISSVLTAPVIYGTGQPAALETFPPLLQRCTSGTLCYISHPGSSWWPVSPLLRLPEGRSPPAGSPPPRVGAHRHVSVSAARDGTRRNSSPAASLSLPRRVTYKSWGLAELTGQLQF